MTVLGVEDARHLRQPGQIDDRQGCRVCELTDGDDLASAAWPVPNLRDRRVGVERAVEMRDASRAHSVREGLLARGRPEIGGSCVALGASVWAGAENRRARRDL